MYSDHSQINNVWFQMALIYNGQVLLISMLSETSHNPVAFLAPSVALDFQNPWPWLWQSQVVWSVREGTAWRFPMLLRVSLWVMSSLVPKLEQKNWVTVQSSEFYWEPAMCKPKLPLQMSSSEYSMFHFLQMIGIIHVHSIHLKHKAFAVGLVLDGWLLQSK